MSANTVSTFIKFMDQITVNFLFWQDSPEEIDRAREDKIVREFDVFWSIIQRSPKLNETSRREALCHVVSTLTIWRNMFQQGSPLTYKDKAVRIIFQKTYSNLPIGRSRRNSLDVKSPKSNFPGFVKSRSYNSVKDRG